jgi:hypothetical protein
MKINPSGFFDVHVSVPWGHDPYLNIAWVKG